ncbi:MAG TPA: IclR family transcriptional regulator [Acidobacteriaceae bacterium]
MALKKIKSAPVGVIGKVLSVLELLDTAPGGLQLKEIAAGAGINKSTAHRFLSHLESEGYLFRDALRNYMVGPKLARLGGGVAFQATLSKVARPVMESLRRLTGETINLAVFDGSDILYIDVIETDHTFRLVTRVGSHLPFYSTSMGKAMVAAIDDPARREELFANIEFEHIAPRTISSVARLKKQLAVIRQRGYALDDEEAVAGVRCLGAAILDGGGQVAAAISISGPVVRITTDRVPLFARELCKAAREISSLLGNHATAAAANGTHHTKNGKRPRVTASQKLAPNH